MEDDVLGPVGAHHQEVCTALLEPLGHGGGDPAAVGDPGHRQPVGLRQRLEAHAVGRPEELLEAIGGELGGLGEEREDAPSVVVDDHDHEVDAAPRQTPATRWCRGGRRRRPPAAPSGGRTSATPTAVETTPSIPLAPRLACTTRPVSVTGVPLDVADGHRRRDHEGTASRHRAATARATPGSVGAPVTVEVLAQHGLDGVVGRPPRRPSTEATPWPRPRPSRRAVGRTCRARQPRRSTPIEWGRARCRPGRPAPGGSRATPATATTPWTPAAIRPAAPARSRRPILA